MRFKYTIYFCVFVFASITNIKKLKAQNGFDLFYDFCTDIEVNSAAISCLADTNKFFVFGNTRTSAISVQHCYLAAFDYGKNLLWTKKILFSERNSATTYSSLCKIGADRYVLTGLIHDYNMRPGKMTGHPYLYIFNGVGDSIRLISHVDTMTRMNTAIHYQDGHIITTGGKELPTGHYALVICKYDTLGNLIWKKQYFENQPAAPEPTKITLTNDKQYYMITGGLMDTTLKCFGSVIVKIDASGNLIWQKPLPKKYWSWHHMDIVAGLTGGYYFASSYSTVFDPSSGGPVSSVLYYGKIDDLGDTIWTKKFIDTTTYKRLIGRQIEWTTDKKHLLIRSTQFGDLPVLIKADTSGNIVWQRRVQHAYNFVDWYAVKGGELNNLSVTPGNQYLMAGYAYRDAGMMTWISLIDSSGCRYPGDLGCVPITISEKAKIANTIKIYPNPATDMVYAELPVHIKEAIAYVSDITGKAMLRKQLKPGRNAIDIADYPTGMYFIKIVNEVGLLRMEKVVKQ